MRKLSKQAFIEEGNIDMPIAIAHAAAQYDVGQVTAVVLFRNQNFDSSSFGNTSMLLVGPGCTFKSPKDCEGKWLNDLPSQRQQPIAWCPIEAFQTTRTKSLR
jgi:hypothetical protein